ncbi:hypothetical protein ACTOB_003828 [Actinoplanes oblitus]|uniref:Uncharacterized protein n=1 Tax=Actinoplanes oblitus TaxID=3040509 RepID=A0ABY8WRR0_9ACTN|nr:hypothetical protein [Actinoplanes oblitus]WIN00143.1 hypothetical protein ACTOB_003828 [Actinoplanes oblitus]
MQLLLATGMREGAWACVVGMPELGVLAAAEAGVPLERLEDGEFANSWRPAARNLP